MKKKEYMKPEQRVVVLQHKAMLLNVSKTSTNLTNSDAIDIDDTPATDTFWGR